MFRIALVALVTFAAVGLLLPVTAEAHGFRRSRVVVQSSPVIIQSSPVFVQRSFGVSSFRTFSSPVIFADPVLVDPRFRSRVVVQDFNGFGGVQVFRFGGY